MFRQLVEQYNVQFNSLTQHSRDLGDLVEWYWESGIPGLIPGYGQHTPPRRRTPLPDLATVAGLPNLNAWDHLVYAYLVENTRIYSIFQRAIVEYRTSEKLGPLTGPAVRWLEATEELFYTEKYVIGGAAPLASAGAMDPEAARRNAYYRVLGYDLNHGMDDGRPYAFVKPVVANREFAVTLETLLAEVWKGVLNARNSSGARDTDDAEMANLVIRLHDMLLDRRNSGRLVREEFSAVATMSWLHMAVESNTAIVQALQASGTSAEQRLRKIGQLVGVAPHAKTHHFLLLARQLSLFLRLIELGNYQTPATVQQLYQPPLDSLTQDIISLYAIATGRDVKAKSVALAPATRPALVGEPARLAVR